ncbi:MAG: hypothetical protein WCA11_10935, partial [Terracidiphilus sp.]
TTGVVAPGANFYEFQGRGATRTACLLARSNTEIGKMATALRVAAKIRPYFILALDGGPATAFGLRFISTPRTKTCPWGPGVWPDFRSQRHPLQ